MAISLIFLGLFATSVASVVAITAMVGLWAVESWATPLAPTVYLATALFGVFIVLTAIWFVVTRRELATGMGVDGASAEERGLQRLLGLAGCVLLGIVALGVIAAWNVDAVRAGFVSGRSSQLQLERALEDPSPIVRLRTCEEIFKRGWVYRTKNALVAALDPSPAMATKCLQTARERDWKGYTDLAANLNDGWTTAMLHAGPADAATACERAPWSPVMSEIAERSAEIPLLHCALAAEADEVRQCCASALASRGKLLDLLGAADQFSADGAALALVPLIQHAFQPLTLSSGQQQVVATLGIDDEAVRRWAVNLGCWSIDPAKAQPQMLRAMFPLIEADSCRLSPAEESEYRSPLAWARLCESVLADESGKPIQQAVCVSVQDTRIVKTVEIARVEIHRAIRAPFLERDAEFLERGLKDAHRMGGIESSERAQEEADRFRVSMSEIRPGQGPESGFGGGITVGEYVKKYRADKEQRRKDIANPFGSKAVKDALKRSRNARAAKSRSQKEFGSAMKAAHDKR